MSDGYQKVVTPINQMNTQTQLSQVMSNASFISNNTFNYKDKIGGSKWINKE